MFNTFYNILLKTKSNAFKNDNTLIDYTTLFEVFSFSGSVFYKIPKIDNVDRIIKDNDRYVYSIINDKLRIRMVSNYAVYPDNWVNNDETSTNKSYIHISEDGTILNSNFLQDFPDIKNIKDISEDIHFYLKLQNKI